MIFVYILLVVILVPVKVSGQASDIDVLKRAAASINTSGLAALKDSGVAAN